jgi:phasin family protein
MTRTNTTTRKQTRPKTAAKASAKAVAAVATPAAPKWPMLDLRRLLEKLKLPGIDVSGLIDSRRKDVEALLVANEQAYRGFEAVVRRQGEMLAEAMKGIKAGAKDSLATKGAVARAQGAASLAQQAFGQALADMKEIAELSAGSQKRVVETLNKRLRESINEAGGRLTAKS